MHQLPQRIRRRAVFPRVGLDARRVVGSKQAIELAEQFLQRLSAVERPNRPSPLNVFDESRPREVRGADRGAAVTGAVVKQVGLGMEGAVRMAVSADLDESGQSD